MINIQRILVKGFKNIKEVNLQLDKITSLLSINSFGKSNLLSGISFGIEYISQPEQLRQRAMRQKSWLPLNTNIKSKIFEFEVEFEAINTNNEPFQAIYGYSFNWSTSERKQGKIIEEHLKIKKINETQKFTNYIKRENGTAYYKSSVTGACDKEIKISNQELIVNKLRAFDDLFYIEMIMLINNLNMYVDRHFDSKQYYDMDPFILKKNSLIDDDNIPRILYKIMKENPNKYKLLINTFKDLFPSIEEDEIKDYKIEPESLEGKLDGNEPFELTDTLYRLFAKDKNLSQKIPFQLMSDGAKRVLMIFTYLTLASIHNYPLIAIEEPENSIHPRLLQQYLIALDNFLDNSKVIITSHSPHLINYIEPRSIYLGIPNENGIADFSKIKDTASNKIMRDASELNMLVGDYLFDLMSGTEEDIEELSSYVE